MSFFDYYVDEMSTYNTNESFGSMAEENAFLESIKEANCSGDPDEILEDAAMEVVENFHSLTEALMVDEFTTYVATNEEVVYEEGRLESIFNSIKGVISKAWAKVKAAFTKFKDMIMSHVSNDKKFVERYKSKIEGKADMKVKLPAVDGKALSFNDIKNNDFLGDLKSKLAEAIKDIAGGLNVDDSTALRKAKDVSVEDKFKEILDGSTEDYYKSIKDKILPEATEVEVSAKKVIDEVASAKETMASAKYAYSQAQVFFASLLKAANDAKKYAIRSTSRKDAKESGIVSGTNKFQALIKRCVIVAIKINRYQLRAISRLRSAYRAAVTKFASSGEDSGAKNEGSDMLARFEASLTL